jgi:hypothetical protein
MSDAFIWFSLLAYAIVWFTIGWMWGSWFERNKEIKESSADG